MDGSVVVAADDLVLLLLLDFFFFFLLDDGFRAGSFGLSYFICVIDECKLE